MDNSNKHIANYQKEIASLKAKLDACGVDRITKI
jgi:hypothetical protein